MEQGLYKLEVDKKKKSIVEIVYTAVVASFNIPDFYLLPLANSFNFNFAFLILPDVISNNTPVPFL